MPTIEFGFGSFNQEPLIWLEALKKLKASEEFERVVCSGEMFDAIETGKENNLDKPRTMLIIDNDEHEAVRARFGDLIGSMEIVANSNIWNMLEPTHGNVREQVEAMGIEIVEKGDDIYLDMGKYYL
jgi:hypothetical protein